MNRRGHAPLTFTAGESAILLFLFWPAVVIEKIGFTSGYAVICSCVAWWIVAVALALYGLVRIVKYWRK